MINIKKAMPKIDFVPVLFRIKPNLKDKVEDVKFFYDDCFCGREKVIATWTYIQDGKEERFAPDSICTDCRNGKTKFSLEDMNNAAISKKWYHMPENDNAGFKNYEAIDNVTTRAKKEAVNYIKEILKGVTNLNLLLMGSTGTGKTHLAKAVGKTAKEKGMTVAFIHAADLFDLIKKTFGHQRHNEMLYEEFKQFDLVIIDDVGLETKKLGEVSWSVTEWTKLVESREGKPTVWTTNFDDTKLADVVGQRAFSRMYMDTRFIDLFTDDYRKKLMK